MVGVDQSKMSAPWSTTGGGALRLSAPLLHIPSVHFAVADAANALFHSYYTLGKNFTPFSLFLRFINVLYVQTIEVCEISAFALSC